MIHVHTLGTAAIDAGASRFTPTATRKFAMLLRLAAEPGQRVSRAQLCDLIFPDQTERNALHSIRELVYVFRQSGVAMSANGYGIELRPDAVKRDYVDVVTSDRPDADQVKAAEGGFLPGYAPDHSEAFSEWLDGYRAKTTFELSKTLLKEVNRAKKLCDWLAMERAARACLALDSLNEEATLAVAEALAIGGAKTQAVKLLDDYIKEVGAGSRDLHVPATVLRRRIGERMPSTYPSRRASPFVGRNAQMLELRERFSLAVAGESRCVALLGEPGIGKSRLAAEFCIVAALEGAEVATAGCQANDVHRPFSAFADLAPRLLNMRGALGCAPASLKAIERLTKGTSGEPIPFEEAVRDSEAMCDSIAHALVDIVDAVAAEQPLVLSIEDIHWTDQMSTRVVASLLSRRKPRRVMILLTSRQRSAIDAVSRYADDVPVIELRGLDSEAIDRMTSELASQNETTLDDEMRAWLERTSVGNPLFLESLVSHYLTTKERFAISPTLSRLLERRISGLSPAAATTLQICALLGKHSTLGLILRATELPRYELLRAVGELEEARLVISEGDGVRAAHALVADVTISSLSPIQARLAHRSVAEALEADLEAAVVTGVVWDCAEHWVAANSPDRAIEELKRCARRALELGRPADASEILSRAIALESRTDRRRSLAWDLAIAADAASEHPLVLEALAVLEADVGTSQSEEIELIRLRTLCRTRLAGNSDVEHLCRLVEAEDANPSRRVRIATELLIYSDLAGNIDLSNRIADGLPNEVVDEAPLLEGLEFRLIQFTVQRAWERAVDVTRMLEDATELAPRLTRLRLFGNAIVPLTFAGHIEESVLFARKIFHEATSAGIPRLCLRAALHLADMSMDLWNDDQVHYWDREVKRLVADSPSLEDDFQTVASELNRACTMRYAAHARALFDRADKLGQFSGSGIRHRIRLFFSVWVKLVEGASVSTSEIEQLVANVHEEVAVAYPRELECAVACEALIHVDRVREAKELLANFLAAIGGGRRCRPRYFQELQSKVNGFPI